MKDRGTHIKPENLAINCIGKNRDVNDKHELNIDKVNLEKGNNNE